MNSLSLQITNILRQHHIIPLYPFEQNKFEQKKDFLIRWVDSYTTPATFQGKKVLLKIPLHKNAEDDLAKRVQFLAFLKKNIHTFLLQDVILYQKDPIPFGLFSFMEGEALGFYTQVYRQFAIEAIMTPLREGIEEINAIKPDMSFAWTQTKDKEWFGNFLPQTQDFIHKENLASDFKDIDFSALSSFIEKKRQDITFDYVPLVDDPGPNNFLVTKSGLALIDFNPFALGNPFADKAEFSSFCITSPGWEDFSKTIEMATESDKKLFELNFVCFLLARIVTNSFLKKQEKNKKDFDERILIIKETLEKILKI